MTGSEVYHVINAHTFESSVELAQLLSTSYPTQTQSEMPHTHSLSTPTMLEDEVFMRSVLEHTYPPNPATAFTTEELVRKAHAILRDFQAANSARSITAQYDPKQRLQVDMITLLSAMLDCAKICGGERYVASVIIASQGADDRESKFVGDDLFQVASDWLLFLLWPCMFFYHFLFASVLKCLPSVKKAYKSQTAPQSTDTTPSPDETVPPDYLNKDVPKSLRSKVSIMPSITTCLTYKYCVM